MFNPTILRRSTFTALNMQCLCAVAVTLHGFDAGNGEGHLVLRHKTRYVESAKLCMFYRMPSTSWVS